MKTVWNKTQGEQREALFAFNEAYKHFISVCKTERECVRETVDVYKRQDRGGARGDGGSAGVCSSQRSDVVCDAVLAGIAGGQADG